MTRFRGLLAALLVLPACEPKPSATTPPPVDPPTVDTDAMEAAPEAEDEAPVPHDPSLLGLVVGRRHACTWTRDGEAVCWGSNRYDQAGRGGRSGQCRPLQVPGLRGVTHMDAAERYTCAVVESGDVTCFGLHPARNTEGMSASQVTMPIESGAVEVAVANDYACARGSDGRVWCWGRGLAAGPEDQSLIIEAREQPGLSRATALAAGPNVACATVEDGPLTCWGSLAKLVLTPEDETRFDPTPLRGPTPAFAPMLVRDIPCVLDEGGLPWCWGSGSNYGDHASPRAIRVGDRSLSELVPLARLYSGCGWLSDQDPSQLWCWVPNEDSARTTRELTVHQVLSRVPQGTNTKALKMTTRSGTGALAGCLLREDDGLMCWNTYGDLLWESELAAVTRGQWATEFAHGCTAIDSDGDGLLNERDRCIDEPEVYNAVDDDDGCPDEPESLVRIDPMEGRIELLAPVKFERDRVHPDSYAVLKHLAGALRGNPHITHVTIEGHTDSRSVRRHRGRTRPQLFAHRVRMFLLSEGVGRKRVKVKNYGAAKNCMQTTRLFP